METMKCFECKRKGQLHYFRRDGKILYWCFPCIEKTVWKMQELKEIASEALAKAKRVPEQKAGQGG